MHCGIGRSEVEARRLKAPWIHARGPPSDDVLPLDDVADLDTCEVGRPLGIVAQRLEDGSISLDRAQRQHLATTGSGELREGANRFLRQHLCDLMDQLERRHVGEDPVHGAV